MQIRNVKIETGKTLSDEHPRNTNDKIYVEGGLPLSGAEHKKVEQRYGVGYSILVRVQWSLRSQ